ncbi:MAG: hypothetical protein M3138_07810 [Actinomycetota bacterium]|nr:hypothetical protein [Actinomycetota bacterium]
MDKPKDVLPRVTPPGTIGTHATPSMSSGRPASRFQRRLAKRLDRLAHRMQRRRERLAVRSERLTHGVESRRWGLTFRLRRRWFLLVDRVELGIELLQVRWYRLISHVPERLARRGQESASRRGALVAAGISVALAVTAIAVLPLDRLDRDAPARPGASPTDPSPDPQPSPVPTGGPDMFPSVPPSLDLSTYANAQAGYLFSYPDDWVVSASPTATVLSDPQGQVLVSFDGAPSGSLQEASDGVLEQLTNAYVSPKIIATEYSSTPQEYPSIVVGGTATDASGASIRFLVVTIEGPEENRAVSIRFPADTDPDDLGAILAVVGSFRFDRRA